MILISPAKSMDNLNIYSVENTTTPRFKSEAEVLVEQIQRLSGDEIEKIFKISSPLALSTYNRYKNFHKAALRPAILSYVGTVFKEMRAKEFSQEELNYAQGHLRIISVLYGLLRPLDLIAEYRLEYKLKLEDINLYKYWKPLLTQSLIDETKSVGGVLLNLGSLDLLPALDMGFLAKEIEVFNVEFKSLKNGKYTNIQTYSKIARGLMVSFIIRGQISDIEGVKLFSERGYSYSSELSDTHRLVFING